MSGAGFRGKPTAQTRVLPLPFGRLLFGFDRIPERIHLGQIALVRTFALGRKFGLNPFKTPHKFGVCGAQGGFGINLEMPCEIGHHKEKIAKFFLDLILGQPVTCLSKLTGLFDNLINHLLGVRPVKSHPRGTFLQLHGAQQGWQAQSHTIQRALLRLPGTLRRLHRLPIAGLLLGGFVAAFIAKDMRMPRDHLVRHGVCHLIKGEKPLLSRHLSVKHRLKQQIAQLAFEFIPGLTLNRIGHLIGLLNGVRRDGGEILLDIPRAAMVRIPQTAHNLQKARHAAIGIKDKGVFGHCATLQSLVWRHLSELMEGSPDMPIVNRIADYAEEMKTWRRHLHAHPELEFDCVETAAFVVERLKEFGVDEIHEGIAKTGVVAIINGEGDGETIGLRADMDALPMDEITGADHASTVAGKMHACGHDGHTTMLLGAAKYLAETRNFSGRVALIFQPAEEEGGGGNIMVQEGMMERFDVKEVYALHNVPGQPLGSFHTTPGPIMAAVDTFTIHIQGKGGHGAYPQDTVDPVVAAVAMVNAIQTIVSRNHDTRQQAVVSVTQIHAGSANNVIPDGGFINGTIRTFDKDVQAMIHRRLEEISKGTAAAYGLDATLELDVDYPATINHPKQTHFAADVAREIAGEANVDANQWMEMGAEDFSYMLEARPGAYLFLGAGEGAGLHHPAFDFNDEISPIGASFFAKLVETAQPR